MTSPLDGIVVADFSRVLAGPLATTMLADLGARVIKIERPDTGDDTRAWGPPWTPSSSSYFNSANRSKESCALDLKDSHDLSLARELIRRSDVLVENFRTGRMEDMGLGYEAAREINPSLIYCSITGFGSGLGAELPGYDFIVQAVGGLMSITGEPDGSPMKAGVALVDVLTSKDATIGVLAALADRAKTGLGQHVEVNLLSTMLSSLANQASAYLATGTAPSRTGNGHPSIVPYDLLKCRDSQLAIACGNDGQYARLVEVLQIPHLANDERFATNQARVANRTELLALLQKALAHDHADSWRKKLTAASVPADVVGDIDTAFSRAIELGLDPLVALGEDEPPQVRHPISYSRSTVTRPEPPPRLGQHTQELRRWLEESATSTTHTRTDRRS